MGIFPESIVSLADEVNERYKVELPRIEDIQPTEGLFESLDFARAERLFLLRIGKCYKKAIKFHTTLLA